MKDLSLHIIDIFQNSVSAKATKIELLIKENIEQDELLLQFKDNGIGMSTEMLNNVTDAFFTTRTTRKVGLGIPLLKQNAEITGGDFSITSKLGIGTEINVRFKHSHIDRQPFGDLAGAVVLTATSYPKIRFIYHHQKDDLEYIFDTDEINEVLDGISIQSPDVVLMLKELIENNLEEIRVKK
ncbi:MAG: ATP-binding protein [Sphingobacteriia bacterium]|nr:ATP-binding protein [Sphingobacteriia bacterium]